VSTALFRAKYAVVLVEGRHMPVLLPPGFGPEALPTEGSLVAAGGCELHPLGAGVLGFTVEPWPASELRCRELEDAKLLDLHYFGVEPMKSGKPFTTRPGGEG
jgi:hypothetical protein